MKRVEFVFSALICFLTLFITLKSSSAQQSTDQIPPISPEERAAVEQAIYKAVNAQEKTQLVTSLFQTQVMELTFAEDAQWGRAWLVPVDSQSGETAPIEPGLVLVHKVNSTWNVLLPPDKGWSEAVQTSPKTLIPTDEKSMWEEMYQQAMMASATAALTGYRLPWKAGETKYLSESVFHDHFYDSGSMHFAFDFYQPGTRGALWDIYAAKSGTVFLVKYDVPTCTQSHCDGQGSGNYLVIKDTSTSPTSYVLYLHLAQNSIPDAYKIIGAYVQRGQFIGVADNTGASYGNHLHFQVQTNNDYWFGRSVDITFEDVEINGGRPRTHTPYNDEVYCQPSDVCDDFQPSYVSRNTSCELPDSTPPNGELLTPGSHGLPVTSTISLSGWGEDTECGLAAGQFIINYQGAWENIGPTFTSSPFSYGLDACDFPDGTIEVGLRLSDLAANSAIVGAYSLAKDYTCPAPPEPACIPEDYEVTLFTGTEYAGTCLSYSPGEYINLGILESQASAIMVGSGVQATLSMADNFTGRSESFYGNDNNLVDNRIGSDTAGAIQVNWRYQQPIPPTLLSPAVGSVISQSEIVTFFWENGIATAESQILLTSSVTEPYTSTWQKATFSHLEGLPVGEYTWQVRGQNQLSVSEWSTPFTFTITATTATPPTVAAPYTDTMETNPSNWTGTGLWKLVNDSSLAHSGTKSWWYQDTDGDYANGLANSGDLTSPAFTISSSGHYYLRFYYRYTTETQGSTWDQRWVQISIDNGPFRQSTQSVTRHQLSNDPYADEISVPYLSSQVFDLGELASGQSIRVRFHFETLDAVKNTYQGWAIDDVGVSATPSDFLGDPNEPNNSPSQATTIQTGSTTDGTIRPKGDFDYFRFTASAGNRIVVDIDAQSIGSLLDPFLYLLDHDGVSVLSENDDEVYAVVRDPYIEFIAPESGMFYLKLRAWNNPSIGGNQYFYTLHFYIDNADPVLDFENPANASGYLNLQDTTLTASAVDSQNGISQVDFFYHDDNWRENYWELLATDTDGTDGWSAPLDRPDQSGVALYVKAIDQTRNVAGQGYWNLSIDRTPPQTALLPLTPTQTSTAFLLEWSGSDNLAGIDHYELQWKTDGGAWLNYPISFTGYTQSTWVIGTPGHNYAFRLKGIDIADNVEAYPSTAETNTFVPANICTTPDEWEPDNIANMASPITIATAQVHNICNPEAEDGLNDSDWITFSVQAGQRYLIIAAPTAPNSAATIGIYTGDKNNPILRAEMTQNIWGRTAYIDWFAHISEVLYIRVVHTDGRVAGNDVTYQVYTTYNYPVFLPVVSRKP